MNREISGGRRWYSSVVINLKSCFLLFRILRKNKLGALIPFVALLLTLSVVLYVISFTTPLAPFVYSLF